MVEALYKNHKPLLAIVLKNLRSYVDSLSAVFALSSGSSGSGGAATAKAKRSVTKLHLGFVIGELWPAVAGGSGAQRPCGACSWVIVRMCAVVGAI